jgi:hypothetical protein
MQEYMSDVSKPPENRFKRVLFPMIIVLVIGVAVLAIMAVQSLNSDQQRALGQYLRAYGATHSGVSVSQIVAARQPVAFSAEMSGPVYGDSPFFRTDVRYTREITGQAGARTLPYPPTELSCVLLDSAQGRSVVFVARHSDLYNAEWLVHEARNPWPSPALSAQLAALGCDLSEAR